MTYSDSDNDVESSTPSISENSELEAFAPLTPRQEAITFADDTSEDLELSKPATAASNGKEEHNDDSTSITLEDAPIEADPAHASETESNSSRSSESSYVSTSVSSAVSQTPRQGAPISSSSKASRASSRPSTPSISSPSLHASSNNVINSGNLNSSSNNEPGSDDSFTSANAPLSLDNASILSSSSPELNSKAFIDKIAPQKGIEQREKHHTFNQDSSSHRPLNPHPNPVNGHSAFNEDENDGLTGLSDEDEFGGALIRDETEKTHPRFVHTLRPMQVRSMPRWFLILMIVCISMIGFGSYAAYDAVAAVQDELMKDMSLTTSQFSWLYSVYSLPNIFLVILGGKMVDKYGSHHVGVWTTTAIAVGAGIVALAPSLTFLGNRGRFFVMLGGRFIFGAGAETSYVVQNSMCVKWFFGEHLAMAMGLAAVGTRLGSISSFVIAPHLVGLKSYTFALWIATGACIISVISVIGYILLRSYAKKHLLADHFDANSLEITPSSDIEGSSSRNSPRTSVDAVDPLFDSGAVELQDINASVDLEEDEGNFDDSATPSGSGLWHEIKIFIRQVRGFSALFWGCAILGVFTYGITLGFRAVAGDSMAARYDLSTEKSNLVMASIDITGLIASPIVGWLLDYTLKLGYSTLIGNILSVAAFALLIPKGTPLPGVISLGLSSSIVVAAIYPAISFLSPPSLEGLAFGLTSSAISAGNLVINFLIAQTLSRSWLCMVIFLLALSIVSVAFTLWWIVWDQKREPPVLNSPRPWTAEIGFLRRWLPFLNL